MAEAKEEKKFVCSICGAEYKSQFGLNGHFRKHIELFKEPNGTWNFNKLPDVSEGKPAESTNVVQVEPVNDSPITSPPDGYSPPSPTKPILVHTKFKPNPEPKIKIEEEIFMPAIAQQPQIGPAILSSEELDRKISAEFERIRKEEREERDREARDKQERDRDNQLQELENKLSKLSEMICDPKTGICKLKEMPTKEDIAQATQEAAQKAAETTGQKIADNLKKQAQENAAKAAQQQVTKEDHRRLIEIINCPSCSAARKEEIVRQAEEIVDRDKLLTEEWLRERGYIKKEEQRLF